MDSRDILYKTTTGPTTKRQLLQMTAWFYDPLGLFSPVSAIRKMLFQETWCMDMQWEEILPHDIGVHWHAWITSLPHLADIHIPRWMGTSNAHDSQMQHYKRRVCGPSCSCKHKFLWISLIFEQ